MDTLRIPELGTVSIKTLSISEFKAFPMKWAGEEGWNPGLADTDIFYQAEPEAHLGIEQHGKILGCGSIVSYDGKFGFMGLFIVDPLYRGKGIGKVLWEYRRELLLNKLNNKPVIGMDGVFNMQQFYQKGGFQFSHRNLRMQGKAVGIRKPEINMEFRPSDYDEVATYDEKHFGFRRTQFLKLWLFHPQIFTLLNIKKDKIAGLISYRQCISGYKIGPLFADDETIAASLLSSVMNRIPGETVFLDIPEINPQAVALARQFSLTEVFGCARMYLGNPPETPWQQIYGITTFELG